MAHPRLLKIKTMFFVFIIMTFPAFIQAGAPADSLPVTANRIINHIHVGERLIFRLRYGFIKAGVAEMQVKSQKNDGNRNILHIRSTARSIGAFDWFYKVRDQVDAYVDANTFRPIRFEKRLREGGFRADTFTEYFPDDSLAKVTYIRYKKNGKIRKKELYEIKIPANVHDVLSALYVVRAMPLQPGKPVFLTGHEKKKIYKLKVIVYPKETIQVKAGTFRCIRIEPLLAGEGIFKHNGRLNIWLTDDDLKIPVQMTTKVIVGSITAELEKIIGIPGPIPAQIK